MKTVTVENILLNAASRAGLDGSEIGNLPDTTITIMLANVEDHVRDAWEWDEWPDLCRTELRTVQTDADGGFYLDLAQSGQTAMGAVFDVTMDNPNTHASPRRVRHWLDVDKVRLESTAPATVYVRYRLEPTEISATRATALAQAVPGILADYVKLSLTGDLLTEDGQLDKAEVMFAKADDCLVREADKILAQQGPRRWMAKM